MPRLNVAGNTTAITGAAAGMGAAIAHLLAQQGANLALIDRDAVALESIAAELRSIASHSTVTTHVVDLVDDAAVAAACADIIAQHTTLQTLITCAGSSMLGSIDQLTMAEMRWLMDVNLWGTVNITQGLLPALRASSQAHITHLASVYALAAPGGRIPYSMSKFAVRGFSEALRHELAGSNVTVGAIYPAGVKTGIILHGRYAAALDPAIADRAATAQALMYDTEPDVAANIILNATLKRRARTMIGRKAYLVDALVRLFPVKHWSFMRGPLRAATDTTTPIG